MLHIGTTRFNEKTWGENETWRRTHGWEGCIYGVPGTLPEDIRKSAFIYVIEMNNERNEIMGVGRIKNNRGTHCRLYSDPNYNRYIYRGKKRVDKVDMLDKECVEILEKRLFKGKAHMKRGQGITRLWAKKVKKDWERISKYIKSLFD